ncbi:hypothetical protein, partial [Vibrio parahaemolyticus]|uniref:hypothetical protein n=3 Tax=Vibrio parahaemolyticus TaxID=670 RepID=UPI001C60ABD7
KNKLQDVSWLEEKHAKLHFFTAFNLAKNTGFELEQQRQRNACFTENFSAPKKPRQRNSPKVRNRKR